MKISKSALDKILSLFVPVNRAQILYKTMKKPTVMLLFSGSCCERVVSDEQSVRDFVSISLLPHDDVVQTRIFVIPIRFGDFDADPIEFGAVFDGNRPDFGFIRRNESGPCDRRQHMPFSSISSPNHLNRRGEGGWV